MKFDFFTKGNMTSKDKKTFNILLIIFLIGLFLIIMSKSLMTPNKAPKEPIIAPNTYKNSNPQSYEEQLEKRFEREFSKIEGVGDVEVIIMLKTSGEIVINKDTPSTLNESEEVDSEGGTRQSVESDSKEATVLINNADGSTKPIILRELEPEISGVVIIAEGGDDIVVKQNLMKAAKVLLDVPAHKIEVMKMVQNKGE